MSSAHSSTQQHSVLSIKEKKGIYRCFLCKFLIDRDVAPFLMKKKFTIQDGFPTFIYTSKRSVAVHLIASNKAQQHLNIVVYVDFKATSPDEAFSSFFVETNPNTGQTLLEPMSLRTSSKDTLVHNLKTSIKQHITFFSRVDGSSASSQPQTQSSLIPGWLRFELLNEKFEKSKKFNDDHCILTEAVNLFDDKDLDDIMKATGGMETYIKNLTFRVYVPRNPTSAAAAAQSSGGGPPAPTGATPAPQARPLHNSGARSTTATHARSGAAATSHAQTSQERGWVVSLIDIPENIGHYAKHLKFIMHDAADTSFFN